MSELHLPWLEMAILVPLLGAALTSRLSKPAAVRRWAAACGGLTTAIGLAAWQDFAALDVARAVDFGNLLRLLTGHDLLVLDRVSAPLLPLTALLYLLTIMATPGAKVLRFPFRRTLICQAVVLTALSANEPWLIIALLSAETLFPFMELRARARPTRVFALHMLVFIACMVCGQIFLAVSHGSPLALWCGQILLLLAVSIRNGLAPAHCWVTDLFEQASFGTALLFVTPLMGAYAATRLLLPVATEGILRSLGWMALLTTVYAAGMALVQKEARRFFCYLSLSHWALVLVGLATATPLGLTGGFCTWISASLALSGLGLSLRALEGRERRLSLTSFHGLYEHTPALAICFLLTGLASVGFPGTFGFWSNELLVDGAVQTFPYLGVAAVLAAALSGVAMVKVYFLLFTGTRHFSTVPLHVGKRERVAVLILAALILGGGVFPQPAVVARYGAAAQIVEIRK